MALAKKLKEMKQKKEETIINYDAIRDLWLDDVSNLFNNVEDWFEDLKQEELVSFIRARRTIDEEFIGSYEIPTLAIKMVDEIIEFKPIGTLVFGVHGRIDLHLKGKVHQTAMLIRMKVESADYTWEIWPDRNRNSSKPFNEENLKQLFEEWIDSINAPIF